MKPSIPKGTRDFGPEEVRKRQFIFDTMRRTFIKYAYNPIETPVMESLSTLMGKYGEEGDKLLFKVLNNGDFLSKADEAALRQMDSQKLTTSISKRGLRYDLTVPFARYVVMHQNDISFPFKRYAIQPVWRADRPQKGRYQEFYQCDVDVVGSNSLMYEAELVQIYDEVFTQLNVDVIIKVNNRKILAGIAEAAGIADKFVAMTTSIDKLDKIGIEGVKKDLLNKGLTNTNVDNIVDIFQITGLDRLEEKIGHTEIGKKGIEELRAFHEYLDQKECKNKVEFDITLARGLSYYTGCIFEVVHNKVTYPDLVMGSIGGGGRYDDLTGIFGLKNVSGVGVSFGAARIYDVMNEMNLFPASTSTGIEVLLIAMNDATHKYAFSCLNELRATGISSDLYPSPAKMKKQMKYANDNKVPYVVIIGDEEMQTQQLSFKNMATGEQESLSLQQIIEKIKNAQA